jgi:hypothetical protein
MKNKMRISLLVAGFAGLCNVVFAQSVDQGKKFLYYQRYKSAKDVFDKILASNPNNIDAIYWDGQTLLATKDSVARRTCIPRRCRRMGMRRCCWRGWVVWSCGWGRRRMRGALRDGDQSFQGQGY